MKVKVSIIIPVYNVEKYLVKCLESAFSQTLKEIEIIAVNDGSTDNSLKILESYKDSRLKIITQENQGLSGARNTGIKIAKGEYLLFLDSDDYIDENMALDMYSRAKKDSASIVLCRYQQVDQSGKIIHKNEIKDIYTKDEHFRRVLSAQSYSMACDKLFKKSLFIDNNIYFPLGLYHEDVYTIYKLFYYSNNICVEEKYFYHWLKREGSISKSITDKHIEDFKKILVDTKLFLEENNCFDKYKVEWTRRGLHYLFGLTNRVNNSDKNEEEKKVLRAKVWNLLVELGLNTQEALENIKKIDKQLYSKLKAKIEYSSKKIAKRKKMSNIKNVIDRVLPIGSNRREFVKKIINKNRKKSNEDIVVTNESNVSEEDEFKKLRSLKNKFKGKRCFIIGNGPSLNKCDLTLLKDEYTFGVNGIFYKTEEMGFAPTFYMVEDGHVVDDNLEKINNYDKPNYKFFPTLYKDKIKKTDNTYFFLADLGFYRGSHYSFEIPRFSRDFSQIAFCGQSVTYLNMQLAYYLGFSEVYLIGMDFSYKIRKTDEVKGQTLVSNEDDINHFHPDYFGKGKKWHDPKVHNVAKNYEFAKCVFEYDNRKIYNATVGGKLEIFERKDYYKLF